MTSNIFYSQFITTPPITRCLSLAILVIMVLVYINAVQSYALLYSPLFIKYMELWRVFTCFLYFGKPSLDVLIHITFLYRYSKMLEEGFIYTADYFYLIFIVWGLLFIIANIFSISMLASAFSSTITYIWTRKNPHSVVQIFGFISFPAFYLPFIVPLFMLVTEKRILVEDLLGIVVGHFYFFFKDVYPKWGIDILKTPCFIKKIFNEHTDDCCKKKKIGKKLNIKNKTVDLSSTKESNSIIKDNSIINDNSIIKDNSIIREDSIINDNNSVVESFIDKSENIEYIDEVCEIERTCENIEKSKINDSYIGEESKGLITDTTIGEESIKEYLSCKINDEEEENGWSSQTLTDTESD